MKQTDTLEPLQEAHEDSLGDNTDQDQRKKAENDQAESEQSEEELPMPFGAQGIAFLCNVTQYAAFLGFTVLVLMIIGIFGPK